ncbi:MAG: hypothetical protein SGPRY_002419 [Prymnesium sp.]
MSCPAVSPSSSDPPIRIVSWNIGLRGLEKLCASVGGDRADVHGISRRASFGSLAALLGEVDADVVCLQEVKLKQLTAAERHLALADGWESYFSLCRVRTPRTCHGRYAGVATFCRARVAPRLAEEGVTGVLAAAQGGAGYTEEVDARFSREEQLVIDGEGRCLLTIHGDLAIFNIYAPALTSDEPAQVEQRGGLKADFFEALEARARAMVRGGLHVLLAGDFNIAPTPMDSAREQERRENGSEPTGSRQWLSKLLKPPPPIPPFVDTFRALHPHARHAYTCFHVAAGADASNFGARIDLMLLCPPSGLEIETSDIESEIDGSDHLPVRLHVRGVALPHSPPPLLPLSSRHRLGGQPLLDAFLGAPGAPHKRSWGGREGPACVSREGGSWDTLPSETQTEREQCKAAAGVTTGRAPPRRKDCKSGGLKDFFRPKEKSCVSAAPAVAATRLDGSRVEQETERQVRAAVQEQERSQTAAWQQLLQRIEDIVPCCRGHGEKCRVQTVKKAGANQGRQFYSCARVEGPRGNPEFNCGFFQWGSERSAQLKRKRSQ